MRGWTLDSSATPVIKKCKLSPDGRPIEDRTEVASDDPCERALCRSIGGYAGRPGVASMPCVLDA